MTLAILVIMTMLGIAFLCIKEYDRERKILVDKDKQIEELQRQNEVLSVENLAHRNSLPWVITDKENNGS